MSNDDATQAADALGRLTGPLTDQSYASLAHAAEHSTGGKGGCNLDYYTLCAIEHFGVEYTDVTPEQRQIAKKLANKWMYHSGHLDAKNTNTDDPSFDDPGFRMRVRIHDAELVRRHEARAEAEQEATAAADSLERLVGMQRLTDADYVRLQKQAIETRAKGQEVDFYKLCAAEHYGFPYDRVTPSQRTVAKHMAFQWLYPASGGQTANRTADTRTLLEKLGNEPVVSVDSTETPSRLNLVPIVNPTLTLPWPRRPDADDVAALKGAALTATGRKVSMRVSADWRDIVAVDGGPDLSTPLGMAMHANRQRERLIMNCNYGQLEARVLASILEHAQ